jgi:hypothetical protein
MIDTEGRRHRRGHGLAGDSAAAQTARERETTSERETV